MERLVIKGEPPDVPFTPEATFARNFARYLGGLPAEGKGTSVTGHVGTEHLLLALAHDTAVQEILRASSISPYEIIINLNRYIKNEDANTPPVDDQGQTLTFVIAQEHAKRLAGLDRTHVTTTHLYAGMIEAGWGMAIITLGGFRNFPVQQPQDEESKAAMASVIQTDLFQFIPRMAQ